MGNGYEIESDGFICLALCFQLKSKDRFARFIFQSLGMPKNRPTQAYLSFILIPISLSVHLYYTDSASKIYCA